MADSTPSPDNTPALSEPPLGVLSSLSGLGLRLQRYALLGSQPLSISQPETLLSTRPSTIVNRLESEQLPASMGLLGKVDVSRSPAAEASSLSTEPYANQEAEPLSAGDIIPPKPSKQRSSQSLQRQATPSSISPAAARMPPRPVNADSPPQPQSPQQSPSVFEPLSAGGYYST